MVEMTETANILNNATRAEPRADGRDRPRHQHLRRPVARVGRARATSREQRRARSRCSRRTTSSSPRSPRSCRRCANVHLDAIEHGDELVFLHAVKDGPANQSFGLQVAALAGVPRAVDRARARLSATARAAPADDAAREPAERARVRAGPRRRRSRPSSASCSRDSTSSTWTRCRRARRSSCSTSSCRGRNETDHEMRARGCAREPGRPEGRLRDRRRPLGCRFRAVREVQQIASSVNVVRVRGVRLRAESLIERRDDRRILVERVRDRERQLPRLRSRAPGPR